MKRSVPTRVLALAGVAVLMLAFILVFERGTLSTTEREQRKGKVLEAFVREKLVRLEVQRKGVTTLLTRKPEEGLDYGPWRVEQPYVAKADGDAVDSVISALEWVDARRTINGVGPQDLAKFGLDKPRYRVSFMADRERGAFTIGSDTPEGVGVYMQTTDPKVVYVVGKDAVEALDHEPGHYHTNVLHETNFSIFGARKLTLRTPKGEQRVEKRGDYFWIASPDPGLASEPQLTALVTSLDELKAQRFVSNDRKDLAQYGLDAPRLDALLESQTYGALPKPGDKPHAEQMRLQVGRACAEHATESYVSVDEGPIHCAANADLEKIEKAALALRDLRFLPLDEGQVRGVRLQSGSRELVLSEEGTSNFRYKLSDHGREQRAGLADVASVADWLKALASVKAESWNGAPPPKASPGATQITFDRGKDKQAYAVVIGEAGGHVAVGRSAGGIEPLTLLFPASLLELITPSTARFRAHAVLTEPEADLQRVVITRADGARETITKNAAGFAFQAPVKAELERSTFDEIVRLTCKLEAVRYVADAAEPQHGLAQPAIRVALDFATSGNTRHHELKLGAPAEGGRYAQLDDDPLVFIAPTALTSQLDEPLVSRDSLATPLETIASVRIEHDGQVIEVQRSGDTFELRGQANDEGRKRAAEITRALATLHASHVAMYGAAPAGSPDAKADTRVFVSRLGSATPAKITLSIAAAAAGSNADADVPVRREDLAVGFTLPRSSVDALLGAQTKTPTP